MTEQYRISGTTATAIASCVEEGVRSAALPPDAQLPPVRGLASQLRVSPATVAAAYQQLRQRGIIVTAGRRGTRVRATPSVATTRSARMLAVPPGVRDLASGDPDPQLLPDLGTVLRALPSSPVRYRESGPLPEVLAQARARMPELPGDASYTLVNGALDGMDRVLSVHLRPGDRVGVEDPGWSSALDLLAALGLVPVPVPVDDDGPTVAGVRATLARGIGAIIITTRAQNPTGAAVSAQRAGELRPLLSEVLLLEDDHAGELAGVPLNTLAGAGGRYAFLRSASKPYGPDLRCAVFAGDPETVSRVEGRMRLGAGWVSTVLQRALMQLWRTHDARAAGREYDRRRVALLTALAERGIPAIGRTGINVWVPVPDETQAVAGLRDQGYAVAPGHLFRIASPPAIRITVALLSEPDMPSLADAIAAAVASGTPGSLV